MNSERIKALAMFITKDDVVVDVGCDHGYLSIYLKKNNLCQEVYASDISANALKMAEQNIKKYHVTIKTFLSNGFENIDVPFNTAVIAGMGTNTILKILKSSKTPNKLILASNNDLPLLRKNLNKMNYILKEEIIIKEKGHYYNILYYEKGKEHLSKMQILFGKSNNQEYLKYLLEKNNSIIAKVPFRKKIKILITNNKLKALIEKM